MRLPLRIVITSAVTVAAALPADAAVARPRTMVFAGATKAGGPVTAVVSHGTLTVRPLVDLGCDDGSPASDAPRFRHMRIHANGRFRGALTDVGLEGSTGAVRVAHLRGSVHSGRLTGTVSETIRYLDDSSQSAVTCRSGRVRFSARHGRSFFGGNSRFGPVTVKLSRDADTVTDLRLFVDAHCADGSALSGSDHLSDFPVASDGSFGDEWTRNDTIDGTPAIFAYAVHGHVAPRKVTGVVRVRITLNGSDPSTQTTCDTGEMRFTARR